jgi:hypothetical protein
MSEDAKRSGIGLRGRALITSVAFLSAVVALTGTSSAEASKPHRIPGGQLAEIVMRQSAASRSEYSERGR